MRDGKGQGNEDGDLCNGWYSHCEDRVAIVLFAQLLSTGFDLAEFVNERDYWNKPLEK